MKVVSVIPIIKGILKKELDYFSAKNISVGDIVTVLVRKKEVTALVTQVEDLSSKKSLLRKSDFELRKVISIHAPSPLLPGFIEAIRQTAEYYLQSPGAVLNRMIPKDLLEKKSFSNETFTQETEYTQEPLAFQSPAEDRLSFYKTYIRESFAKRESLFICVPTSKNIELLKSSLHKGVESYLFTLHPGMTKKKATETLSEINKQAHPIVVIGTPSFLYALRKDTGTIILENESSSMYKTFISPLFDIRTLIRFFAKSQKIKLILADTILLTETIWDFKQTAIDTLMPPNFRFPQKSSRVIVDTSKESQEEKTAWKPISTELETLMKKELSVKGRVFLFTLRKGLAPFTTCNDCKKTLNCKTCDIPLTLYKQKTKNDFLFICNNCNDSLEPLTTCPYCNSWNLHPLGIGTEKIAEEISKLFPDNPVFLLDQSNTKTKTQAKKTVQSFESTQGAILIGTELALHQNFEKKIPLVGVSSFDSLFAIPSFRIHEKILHLLINLEELSTNTFAIQTKNPEASILKTFKDNTFIQYYNNEITQREAFNYPPFSTLIKIIPDNKTSKKETKKIAESFFGQYQPNLFITKYKNKKVPAILLKIPKKEWSHTPLQLNPLLKETLMSLPPNWVIHVDPEQT